MMLRMSLLAMEPNAIFYAMLHLVKVKTTKTLSRYCKYLRVQEIPLGFLSLPRCPSLYLLAEYRCSSLKTLFKVLFFIKKADVFFY